MVAEQNKFKRKGIGLAVGILNGFLNNMMIIVSKFLDSKYFLFQLIKFKQWRDYLDIINVVHIIAFNRSKCNFIPLPNMNITWIEDFQMNISSELIRKDIAEGKLNKDDLTPYIKNYIIKNKLYGY